MSMELNPAVSLTNDSLADVRAPAADPLPALETMGFLMVLLSAEAGFYSSSLQVSQE